MHDVHKDSIIVKGKKQTITGTGHDHSKVLNHTHDHPVSHGHDHEHGEEVYNGHDYDLHVHKHNSNNRNGVAFDRAFAHIHEHGHDFFHSHYHTHHPEHAGIMHKIFGDPRRDWFAVVLMVLLIVIGYFKWLPGHLSDGMLLCAAIIGIFPVLKNGVFGCIYRRTFRFELLVGFLLLIGLFMGEFLVVDLITLLLLLGSFLRLNFSWKD